MPLHITTPLIESRALSLANRRSVWLKMEALQPPGSFKIRGIGAACEAYRAQGAKRFVSSSGGNAGIAVAYAGRHLGIPVTVVVPETATEQAKALIRQEGAELIVHGASWQEANTLATSLVGDDGVLIHPFDDPLLWPGHASMIDEVAQSGLKPDAVVLSVGGGGLLCGVVEGLWRNGWNNVPVIAVETEGAASLNQSIQAGQRIVLDRISSIATSLGAKQVCEQAFSWTTRHPIRSIVVSDRSAINACEHFLHDHRIVVEPACGAALALAYDYQTELANFQTVLFIVCGGVTATVSQLRSWADQLANQA
ncbi:pyridoxal-phosphate dependent enzyme [Chitinivorax sp. B]|uniref:pyridoxal-phosphate dependent enzyme n=1 Tax=Chitinivorax sp. B TaxID=2502235 RepID=UPI0010F90C17|nr:pyridoxal-phosphate dependent enzyme [Chitinivorax sp. B]